jgi:hypothetical protein
VRKPIQLHASLLPTTSADPDVFTDFCLAAEQAGFASVHVPIAERLSDALSLAATAGEKASRLSFRIGWSFCDILKSLGGHALRKTWSALGGRLILHMRVDALPTQCPQDDPFLQAAEFLENCRKLFNDGRPRFEVEGESAASAFLAIKHADCLWRPPHRPHQVYADALPILHFGKQVGLLAPALVRQERQEAIEVLSNALPAEQASSVHDPASWITPWLWSTQGSAACGFGGMALVGSTDEIARALHGLKTSGVSQFLIREWPEIPGSTQEILTFAASVMPKVREIEAAEN